MSTPELSPAYRDQLFVALTTVFNRPDDAARQLIDDNAPLLASYERRRFEPSVAAKVVLLASWSPAPFNVGEESLSRALQALIERYGLDAIAEAVELRLREQGGQTP